MKIYNADIIYIFLSIFKRFMYIVRLCACVQLGHFTSMLTIETTADFTFSMLSEIFRFYSNMVHDYTVIFNFVL